MDAKKLYCFLVALLLSVNSIPISAACIHAEINKDFQFIREFADDVLDDYYFYYTSPSNLAVLGGVILTAGLMANSDFDHSAHHYWQGKVRNKKTDGCLWGQEKVGLFPYTKVYVVSMAGGYFFRETELGNLIYHWGNRTLRSMFIVSPQITFLRKILGGGRPNNANYPHSKWRFMVGGRASCSGHTFNGALPFISAAMMTDNLFLKTGFYALSILPGVSRINDGKHYASQIFLGWSLAFMAVRVVDFSDSVRCRYPVVMEVIPAENGAMLHAGIEF